MNAELSVHTVKSARIVRTHFRRNSAHGEFWTTTFLLTTQEGEVITLKAYSHEQLVVEDAANVLEVA